MKRFWVFGALSIMAAVAFAKVEFKSIESKEGKIEVVMVDPEAGDNVMVTSAKLINNGREIPATMMMCGLSDGVGTYTLTFPGQKSFSDPAVSLVINGEESITGITVDLEDVTDADMEENDGNTCKCPCGCEY